ncbi:nucleotidyltransferase family protein [Thioclava sp. FR2]|uniref:nucleotidyltransferase family protein n=1 Tax=Thioclava sp. FR2 TaxID=3445780 RepID=UPI003EB76A74
MRPKPPLMLFAAGFGTRMGALTASRPKPLIEVAGKALLDHAREVGVAAGLTRQVVNAHYMADQITAHLEGSGVAVSVERERILDTGGGLRRALPMLGPGPVVTLNTDAVWTGQNPLTQLLDAWDDARMDVLFLVLPASVARSATGRSDFVMDADGRISWAKGRDGVLYLGAQILNPRILEGEGDEVFSLHRPWTAAIEAGRAFGVIHQGDWCDVGHPGGIAEAEAMLNSHDV